MSAGRPASLSGLLLALAAAAAYGCNISFVRLASFAGLPGTALVFYRVLVVLAVVAAAAPLLRRGFAIARGERGALTLLALGTAVVGTAYLSAVAYIPVTVAVVIFYTFPVVIVLTSPLVDGTRLSPLMLAIAALAFTGVVLVVGPAFDGLDPRGLVLATLASLGATVQFFAAARLRRTGNPAKVLWMHVMVLPVTALIGLATGGMVPPQALALAPLAVTMTIAGYMVGFVLQMVALARTSAVVAGLAFCLEPVVAALTSALVLDERMSALQLFGGSLVLAAIVTNVIVEHRRSRTAVVPDTLREAEHAR